MRPTELIRDPAPVIAGAALLVSPLAILAPLGIAPLAGVAVLLVLAQYFVLRRRWPPIDRISLAIIGLFVLWAGLTAFWSLLPERSIASALRVGIICLGGLVLIGTVSGFDTRQRSLVSRGLAIGAIIAAALLAINFATDIGINRLFVDEPPRQVVGLLNRSASVIAILCWPIAIVAGQRWRYAGIAGVLIATVVILVQLQPAVPIIAFTAGILFFGIGLRLPKAAAGTLMVGLVVVSLLIPLIVRLAPQLDATLSEYSLNENSISHRLGIWSFGGERILSRPLTGWGFDASRALPGGNRNLPILGKSHPDAPALPLHPHNATIQIWLEAGLPGLLLAAFLVLRALRRIPQIVSGRTETAAVLAMSAALLVIANLSYGIWQGWWLCLIWLSVAIAMALTERPRTT